MEWVLLLLLVVIGGAYLVGRQRETSRRQLQAATDLAAVTKVAGEDVTVFGEELQELHIDTLTTELDTAMRQDYQRALNSYETAKERLDSATAPEQVKGVTEALEDGRYAMACVRARQAGEPLPTRRSPCFFNPQHGPSITDVEWAPPGGVPRPVPACAADAERVAAGAEPDIRTVEQDHRSVPYWKSGRAYQPYAMGYYGGFADVLPMFFVMTMLNSMWMGGMVNDFDSGYSEGYQDGLDAGGEGGDAGGEGGDAGDAGDAGGDFGGGDFGGGWGGFDGGGDFGGF